MFNINKISLLAVLMMIFSTSAFPQKKEMEMADSEFNALQYNAASEFYQQALAKFKEEDILQKQDATFKLAECYRLMNDPGNQQANKGVRSCEWVIAHQGKKAQVNVSDVRSLNSAEDDFCPVFYSRNSDQLILTSNRPAAFNRDFSVMYFTRCDMMGAKKGTVCC